ncbi:hypothetical protein MNBD_GAMMA24-1310 [hydrothermal vent metagenome]|uniref:DUF1841 domain-containing protein n=1 Tax=hydrothermal vent metagenome TaxID=652676 RepID=A0A3B1BDB1_9ZZZZ
MFGQDRNAMRRVFFEAWEKYQAQEKLEAMESILVQIITLHPEYHALFKNKDNLLRDFSASNGESNPFLHMSLHLAIQEQLSLRRPAELSGLYQQLMKKYADTHVAEHEIMECLSEMIWQAQRNQSMANEHEYIECIRKKIMSITGSEK